MASAKYTSGDFNGDGRDDFAALYRYNDGSVQLHSFFGTVEGRFVNQLKTWSQASGWDWDRTTLLSGDATADGRDDLLVVHGHADNRYTAYTFVARADGGFDAPIKGYEETHPGWWYPHYARYAAGDFNGDGRADMAAVYVYPGGTVRVFTSLALPDGAMNGFHLQSWESPAGTWDRANVQLTSGDVNADGRGDLVVMYKYPNERMALWTFLADSTGGFAAPTSSNDSGDGNWDADRSVPLAGDVDGDGRADVSTLYNYGTGQWRSFSFISLPTGGFEEGSVWSTAPGLW